MPKISAGQQIRIYENGRPLIDSRIPLVIKDEITLVLSSTFETLLSSNNNKWLTTFGNVIRDLSGVGLTSTFAFQGYQVWKSTEPLSFNVSIPFFFGSAELYDARREVYEPIMKLAELPLPYINKLGKKSKGTTLDDALTAPGPSILPVLFPNSDTVKNLTAKGRDYSVEIGNIVRLSNVIFLRAEPTFSLKNVDENGYPIFGTINLDVKTVEIATIDMLRTEVTNYRYREE